MACAARFRLLCLVLVLVLVPHSTFGITRNDLYPYASHNVLQVDTSGEIISAETTLKTPIVFYDKVYNDIYVNGNGVISFIRAMARFFNIAFPLDDPVIAPLYTHVDIRGSGTIHWGESDSPEILSRAAGIIRSAFKEARDFMPTNVFIATWVDVGYYNEKSDKVNTYQVAISSNGTHSFVELLYPENGVQWIQGESHPNGLPDARAQAGFMSEGVMYTLRGSGTDHIQNIDKWSNVDRPGHWIFQVGPIPEGHNIKVPDNIDDSFMNKEIESCRIGASTCHSKASCVDYENGFCCSCREGYFGNGKFCQPNDVPLRVIGRVSGKLNGIEFPSRDLQCYVQTKDGRTYTAISRVPEGIGASFQLLNPLGGIVGWLFAKPVGQTKNGYQQTGGVFNHTAELLFTSTGDKAIIRSNFYGLDVFGQLKMDAEITGTLPDLTDDAKVEHGDYEEMFTRSSPGMLRSQSTKSYKLAGVSGVEYPFTEDQVITFEQCPYAPVNAEEQTSKLKFSRGVTTYESTEGIVRFAVNTKITPLEEEDPCIQGQSTCVEHSSCVVDGDDFKCVCNPGYQYLYEEDGTANCVDINECTAGIHTCSSDAQCINNEGSHTCQCRPGFRGDGRHCEKVATCEDTRCLDYEECKLISGLPVCTCIVGFEQTDRGCYPIQKTSCDVAQNCSPYGACSYDGDRQSHVCVCLPGYVGDGYNCKTEEEAATTDGPPSPKCIAGMCWCPNGWEFRENYCVKMETTTTNYGVTEPSRDFLARPVPECLEELCFCPLGYDYKELEKICVSRPGSSQETMGASGSHLSCNVVNRCHPYAQCIFISSTEGYECRCSSGYEGDGMECVKTEVSCLEVDICDPNASCRSDEPLGTCACNPGYEGDGITCNRIDECSGDSECRENERCSYNPSSSRYECSCNPGYSMVDGQCIVSDCSTNPGQCHVNAHCMSTASGGFKCACISGYHGDGIHQCIEDHIGCNVVNNCGRYAVCGYNQTSKNYACLCLPGYYGDGFNCLPQTSCRRDPSVCSPDAACVPVGDNRFACICNDGYTGDGIECNPRPRHDSNFLLVNQGMATHRIPFFPTSLKPGIPIYIAYTQLAVALDIDCLSGRAYSSDITQNRIIELTYNGSMTQTFITGVSSPEGISVDWVSRNIFWTDSGKGTVEVASLVTKKRKVLVSDGLVNPRGIAVHPYRGKIFWSDWNRASPKLEWSNEDGSGRSIFLQGNNVKLPNSLCIDWASDELCWADAGTFTISCVQIDTREVHVVAKDLVYPFGLAISQNHYYWTDWKTHKIEVLSKSSRERNSPLSVPAGGSGKLYGIVVVPESCPKLSNVCQYENGRCNDNQLCLPDGYGGRTCACADDADGACTDS